MSHVSKSLTRAAPRLTVRTLHDAAMGRGDQRMPWRRLCFARLCRMNVKFSDARSIRPRDFACSETFGAAPDSTGERKPHMQTLRKSPKFPGNRITRWLPAALSLRPYQAKEMDRMRSIYFVPAFMVVAGVAFAQPKSPEAPVTQQGQASYFNGGQNGHTRTANGEPVQADKNTAASRTLPLGTE